ncbi:MAG: hypothetical protein ACD_8C00102G0004 [uncultured bacterium]|nr:MAG: hypothetical protein ACD_8C00102G0004 [uncultured bacterium]
MAHEILLGLTTTPRSDWHGKVKEMKKFGIKKIALFPTFLNIEKRKELYNLLAEIEDLEIPHVHLRCEDMEQWEFDLFERKYGTRIYNVHEEECESKPYNKYKNIIYIENRYKNISLRILDNSAGLCVDFAHMEDGRRRKNSKLDHIWDVVDKYPIGCAHVSAIKTNRWSLINHFFGFDRHYFKNLCELDYIGQYRQYLPYYISLELENSFEQQLEAKKYLENKLNL